MRMSSRSLSTTTSGPSSRPSCFSSGERGACVHPALPVGGVASSFCSCEAEGGGQDPGTLTGQELTLGHKYGRHLQALSH